MAGNNWVRNNQWESAHTGNWCDALRVLSGTRLDLVGTLMHIGCLSAHPVSLRDTNQFAYLEVMQIVKSYQLSSPVFIETTMCSRSVGLAHVPSNGSSRSSTDYRELKVGPNKNQALDLQKLVISASTKPTGNGGDGNQDGSGCTNEDRPMLSAISDYHELITHEQSPEESQVICAVAKRVKRIRQQYGFTKFELARRLCIDHEVIFVVENGDGNSDTANDLLQRCEQLVRNIEKKRTSHVPNP